MASDLVLATESAQFGFPEVHHGLVPGLTMALLVDRVSTLDANHILYFGERFDARQALGYGIVNEIVADAAGEATLAAWVERLAKGSPTALKLTKRLARQLRSLPTASRYAAGIDAVLVGRQTDDAREGVAAFREKRKPNWIR
jgi:enoyl-CoA hydratase/carnithine racemase